MTTILNYDNINGALLQNNLLPLRHSRHPIIMIFVKNYRF